MNGFTKNTREKDFIKNTNSKRHNSNIRPKYFNSMYSLIDLEFSRIK